MVLEKDVGAQIEVEAVYFYGLHQATWKNSFFKNRDLKPMVLQPVPGPESCQPASQYEQGALSFMAHTVGFIFQSGCAPS